MSTITQIPRPRPTNLTSARLSAIVQAAYLLELASR
jgi:hypothetical protein